MTRVLRLLHTVVVDEVAVAIDCLRLVCVVVEQSLVFCVVCLHCVAVGAACTGEFEVVGASAAAHCIAEYAIPQWRCCPLAAQTPVLRDSARSMTCSVIERVPDVSATRLPARLRHQCVAEVARPSEEDLQPPQEQDKARIP